MGSNINFTPCRAMLLLATIGIVFALWLEKIGIFCFYSVNLKKRPKIGIHHQSLETTQN
jgi:hypothetical protein